MPAAEAPGPLLGSLFGLSPTQALVLLFVVLPFAVAAVVIPFVAWRNANGPKPVLTSEILAHGVLAHAEILSVRQLGSFLDLRPMVRFLLRVTADPAEPPFELEVVQSLPRYAVRDFRPGDRIEVRLTPDHSAGAVVWSGLPPAR
jgi:hypothetical protein